MGALANLALASFPATRGLPWSVAALPVSRSALWQWHLMTTRREPPVTPHPQAFEPLEEM